MMHWIVPIIYLGDSKFSNYETLHLKTDSPLVWAVSNYSYSCYEWDWYLFAKWSEWEWYKWDCGHCSCYWPLEHWYSGRFTQEEILILAKEVSEEIFTEIEKYILETK